MVIGVSCIYISSEWSPFGAKKQFMRHIDFPTAWEIIAYSRNFIPLKSRVPAAVVNMHFFINVSALGEGSVFVLVHDLP